MTWTNGASRTSTPEHKRWRAAVLRRDHDCQVQGPHCTGQATQADHIRNVAQGGAEYDANNGQGVCGPCHRDKTQREAAQARWPKGKLRPTEPHPGGVLKPARQALRES